MSARIIPEALLECLYLDEAHDGDGKFFEHVGLPAEVTWDAFRRHYDDDGAVDMVRLAHDIGSFPKVAEHIQRRAASMMRRGSGREGR